MIGWKNLSYWLRGSTISVLLFIVLVAILIPFGDYHLGGGDMVVSYYFLPFIIPSFLFGFLFHNNLSQFSIAHFFIISFVFYFIIGALVGLIVGKIKNKKEGKN